MSIEIVNVVHLLRVTVACNAKTSSWTSEVLTEQQYLLLRYRQLSVDEIYANCLQRCTVRKHCLSSGIHCAIFLFALRSTV